MWRAALIVALLAGCAPRAALVAAPPNLDLATRTVFVTSQRGLDPETGRPGALRAEETRHQRFEITLPPDRAEGKVTFPIGKPDPQTDMLVSQSTPIATQKAMISAVRQNLARRPEKQIHLYIHGYNNTFADGVLRTAQMAEDFDFNGVSTHFSWASAGNPLAYAYDRDSIMASRVGLSTMIEDLSRLPAQDFILIAHSVGADLLMEVLRDFAISGKRDVLRALDGVVLISPDIDIDVFKAQARRIGVLPQPFIIVTSPNDRALAVSARLTGQTSRVGSLPDAEELDAFDIVFIDVSAFSNDGDMLRHFTAVTSPEAIRLIGQLSNVADTLGADAALRPGLVPGTVLRVREATRIILGQP
jgi:esterase/lipase superfamily enzyme